MNSIVLRKTTNECGVVRATHFLAIEHLTFRCNIEILTLTTLFLDIDECTAQVNPCDDANNFECKNTRGSYNCQCKDGFVKNGDDCEGTM